MANTPNVRFEGFADDWEQRKLGDIILDYAEKNPDNENLPVLTSSRQGIQKQEDHFGSEQKHDTTDYNVIPKGYCTYRNRSDDKTFTFNVNDCVERGIVSKFYPVFSIENGNAKFITEYLNTNGEIRNKLAVLAVGTSQVVLSLRNLKALEILVPSKEEQDKVGQVIVNLDSLITLHQRKYDEVKQLKKFMLQKMFPKNGELIPEIRFAGFTGDWKQRKLGEITETKSASRVHKGEWTTEGVPFYRSSDVMAAINGTENDKAFISQELYEKLSSVSGKLEAGDILVTGGGSVGNPYIVPDNAPLYTKDADLLWIKNQGRFNPYFVYEFFLSPSFKSYLGSISHVGTIAHYTITQLSETPISLPSVEEQDKIGAYFRNLDHLITLHQRKCDELKEVKCYMLQNMFPQKG